MQLAKKSLSVLILGASACTPTLHAAGGDEVKFKQMKYSESDDRMEIDFSVVDIKKDFGTDHTLSASFAYDSMSGGTPVWDTTSGASGATTTNSADPRCTDAGSGDYICQDTSSNKELLSNGQTSKDAFAYKKTQVDDTRKSISLSLLSRTKSRNEISTGFAYSTEEDFKSMEGSLSYLFYTDKSKNASFTVGASYQQNSSYHFRDKEWKDFDMVNAQIGFTKTVNKRLVAQINYFGFKQDGVLTNPYQTVIRYFNISNSSFDPVYNYFLAREKRPSERIAQGISTDMAYKVHPTTALHTTYRLYNDDWGITSHTLSLTSYIETFPKITLVPMLRYYKQSAASFFKEHKSSDNTFDKTSYATNDERLGDYDGLTYSFGIKTRFKDSVNYNLHFAKQKQSFGLSMTWFSAGLSYKF